MDETAERAEEELDKFLDEWQRRHRLRDMVATDMLLRQACRFHFRELSREVAPPEPPPQPVT